MKCLNLEEADVNEVGAVLEALVVLEEPVVPWGSSVMCLLPSLTTLMRLEPLDPSTTDCHNALAASSVPKPPLMRAALVVRRTA